MRIAHGVLNALLWTALFYIGVRLFATGVDVFQRWRAARAGDVHAWKA